MNNYKLQAPYEPNGDQPEAIKKLVKGVNNGKQFQTLLGATGTGKTFTIANVIQQTGRPALGLPQYMVMLASDFKVGTFTHTWDSPDGSHLAISYFNSEPELSRKRRSPPFDFACA